MLKWVLSMGAGFVVVSSPIFYVYHLILGVSLSGLVEPWIASVIFSACCAPLFYLGRNRMVRAQDTRMFYVVCAIYASGICSLAIHYSVGFHLLAPQAANSYYAVVLIVIPAAMVLAYLGNRALFNIKR